MFPARHMSPCIFPVLPLAAQRCTALFQDKYARQSPVLIFSVSADCRKNIIPVNKGTGTLKYRLSAFYIHVDIIPCPFPGKPAIITCLQQIGQHFKQLSFDAIS